MTSATPIPTTNSSIAATAAAADGFNGLASTSTATAAHIDPGRPTTHLNPYRLVLLDIEGTTTDIAFVHDTLFPYARLQLAPLIHAHLDKDQSTLPADQAAQVHAAIASLHTSGAFADPTDADAIVAHLHALMDSDTKSTPLKSLQGLLWDTAYKRGEIQAHLYSDVLPMLYYWQALHVPVGIYSSGSIHAQKLLFTYSQFGDVTPLLAPDLYFDTTSGPKLESGSYTKIFGELMARGLAADMQEVLFVSDNPKELVAARQAGLQVVLVDRPGNPLVTESAKAEYPTVQVLSQLVWPELHTQLTKTASSQDSLTKKRKRTMDSEPIDESADGKKDAKKSKQD